MPVISFDDLLGLLPSGADLGGKCIEGVLFPSQPNPQFVEPDLIVEQPVSSETAVVLLSAPGAVGKSTLASEIAARNTAPLWDLSRFQVGTGTFSGTILEIYGFTATGAIKRFREGDALFVLDALDEAQVRAGSQNFDAFLADLAEISKTTRRKPSLVLLARSDTADWVRLFLEELGVPLAQYTISCFDEARSKEFIDKLLDARRRSDSQQPIHRQQPAPYSRARGALFDLIYRLFSVRPETAWNDPRVQNFLGYAPVLEALTGYLDVSNYMPLITELERDSGLPTDPWQFLAEIIHKILERETNKVVEAIRPRLSTEAQDIGWSAWDSLYTQDEQCARILSHALSIPTAAVQMELPEQLSGPYDEGLSTQLPQHPFLAGRKFANVVFKEYCYAWGLIRGATGVTSPLRDTIRHREHPFLPSQVFGWFIVNLEAGDSAVLEAQDFGLFYESLQSRSSNGWLMLTEVEGLIRMDFDLELGGDEVSIELIDTGQGLWLWRMLQRAEIDVSCGVRLGLQEQRFTLGPEVDIRCGELAVWASNVDVAGDVTISAESYSSLAPELRLRVRNRERGELAVTWPGVAHPWAPYRIDPPPQSMRLTDTIEGDALRKFILMFHRQRRRKMSTVQGARWSPAQLSQRDRLLELAFRMGVLRKVPGDRHDTVELTNEFLSLRALIRGPGELSPSAQAFVTAFLGSDEAERVLS